MRAHPNFRLATLLLLTPLALCIGVAPLCHAAGFWTNNLVDYPNAVTTTGDTSVDEDLGGQFHISYYDAANGNLMYSGPGGTEIVDSTADVGFSNSLDVRGYEISIAYWDSTNDRLKFAKRNGSSWDIEIVDTGGGMHCSLDIIDPTNHPGISYFNSSGQDLRYAYHNGTSWQIQTVDAAGNVGHHSSLRHEASTPYHPHIAYAKVNPTEPGQIEIDYDLKYAEWTGSTWRIQTVETQYVVGKYASIDLDAEGYANSPGIAYYRTYWSTTSGQVRHLVYATQTHYPDWDIETVDTDAGEHCSLQIDVEGDPRISYLQYYWPCCEPNNSVLKYASRKNDVWARTRVNDSAGVGWFTSLALGHTGTMWISHLNPSASAGTGLVLLAKWTECPDPATPALTSPVNGTTCGETTSTFQWDAVFGATEYDIQIGTGGCGTGPIYTVTDPEYTAVGLVNDESYTWRVRAKNACGTPGPWTGCWFYYTKDTPPTTTLLHPADGATGLDPDQVTIVWSVHSSASYAFQVGTSCETGPFGTTNISSYDNPPLAPGETFYWRVRTLSECGEYGPWEGCWNFTTANSPTGTDVIVDPGEGLILDFDEITEAGDTSVETSSSNPGPDVNSYMFMGTFYDITTTATYEGEVDVCLQYDDTGMSEQQERGLGIFHLEGGVWVDITTSVNINTNTLCGTTLTLSPFGAALFMPWMPDGTSPAVAMTDDTVGVSWGDYDGDGDPDLYVVNHAQPDKMFRNDGLGVFTDVTAAPLGHTGQGSVGCWADYDNDGDKDLYLTVRDGANVLYRNDNGKFVDATAAPLDDAAESHGAAWLDYDLDGDLDVYVSNYSGAANHLYRNDGGGVFTDVSAGPINHTGQTTGAAIADYDDDGDPDIYITNTGAQPNRLFRNDGAGAWTDITPSSLSITTESRGAAWGDFDNDGDLDLYVANGSGANQLFRNDGSNVFADVSAGVQADTGPARGVGWQDYDNDGDLDLYIANLNSANKLLQNQGWGIFTDETITPLDDAGYGIGAAWADYDGDGDSDLYLGNAFGPNVLFRNDLVSSNHWLHVRLSGVTSNRGGVGARIRVVAGVLDQIREVQCGSGYVSEASLAAEFGLGTNMTVDLIEVYWPSGTITSIDSGIGIDRAITVAEGATGTPDLPGVTRMYQPTPNPFNPRTTVSFDIAEAGPVTLRVYDSAGRLVRTLLNGVRYEPGNWHEVWNGNDANGASVASGVYHVRFEAPGKVETKSVTLIR